MGAKIDPEPSDQVPDSIFEIKNEVQKQIQNHNDISPTFC